jgi:gluconolactonase
MTSKKIDINLLAVLPVVKSEFYTEGPAFDKEGNIYFTTLTGGKILKVNPEGITSVWAETPSPNGQRILANGDHLVCDSQLGKVIRFDALGEIIEKAAFGKIEDIIIQTPNDLAVDEENGFYFTDSLRHVGVVFYKGFDGTARIVARNIDYPNGIVLSADRKYLLVAESYQNRIILIKLTDAGYASGKPEVFAELPMNDKPMDPDHLATTGNLPDGLALDKEGKLWVAHYGMQALQVIDAAGNHITSIDTGIPATSNLCFSTPDYKSIIVSGGIKEPGPGLMK